MDKHLHIVCFDVPYPADYGGVFDLFYKIKSLHKLGTKIHLHCFKYGRGEQTELRNYCEEVTYYTRNIGLKGFSFQLPYIASSRANKNLLQNLLKDDHPVLLEGIHCTYFLYKDQLKNKKVFVRLHNVEYEYYYQLAKSEPSFFKKIYLKNESRLLKTYERKIAGKAVLLSVSEKDNDTYKKEFGKMNIHYLPVFLPYTSVTNQEGKGNYCLYHGNLAVSENEKAAIWLIENIFIGDIPFTVAGKNPSRHLLHIAKQNKNVSVVANPSLEKMQELISNAQINVLPSFNSTGIKVKLLNALFNGRHCAVNNSAVDGTGFESLCHIASDVASFKTLVNKLFNKDFTKEEIYKRKQLLEKKFNNDENAKQLIQWIWQ